MFLTRLVCGTKIPARLVLTISCLLALAGTMLYLGHRSVNHASAVQPPAVSSVPAVNKSRLLDVWGALPLAFERNDGQADSQVKYLARGRGYTLFLTPSEAVLSMAVPQKEHQTEPAPTRRGEIKPHPLNMADVRMKLVRATTQPRVAGEDTLPGVTNYLIGNDPKKWRTSIPRYSRVHYRNVYPGVDLAFYGSQKNLEFDFLVSPGASPQAIALQFSGANQLRTDDAGDLLLSSPAGDLRLHRPIAYQENKGVRQPVEARFLLQSANQVGFVLGNYDRTRELVIDPTLSFSTYLGGAGEDDATAIAVDGSGNAYITGQTNSTSFPSASRTLILPGGGFDVFVCKLNAAGVIQYLTFVGGTGADIGEAIAVDGSGNAYVTGGTLSTDFPATNGFQTTRAGSQDAFVLKLNSLGTVLTYSTYLGGNGGSGTITNIGFGVAVDSTGNAYVVGETLANNFPGTAFSSIQSVFGGVSDGFVSKVSNTNPPTLLFSTYLGGNAVDVATAVALDSSNNVYVTGDTLSTNFPVTAGSFQQTCGSDGNCNSGFEDAFVIKINSTFLSKAYSTYLGGSGKDIGLGIAVDSTGAAYVSGLTQSGASGPFPTANAFQGTLANGATQNAFVTKLNPTGTAPLVYSTYFGGSGKDAAVGIALDNGNNAYFTGLTSSNNFPTKGAFQATCGSNCGGSTPFDAFVAALNSGGNALIYSSYLGGSGNEDCLSGTSCDAPTGGIAVDRATTNVYIAGVTGSSDLPTKSPAQPTSGGGVDAFVAKVVPSFSLTATAPSPNPVAKGSAATSTVAMQFDPGFPTTTNVALTCSGPSGVTCTPNPASVTSATPNSTVTINVSSTASLHSARPIWAVWLPIPGLAFIGMGLGSAMSTKRKALSVLLGCLLFAALVLQAACGSSGGGGGGGGTTPYTVTVTGTGGGQTSTVPISGSFK
jgi:beta-propeller repeat-containing protein